MQQNQKVVNYVYMYVSRVRVGLPGPYSVLGHRKGDILYCKYSHNYVLFFSMDFISC